MAGRLTRERISIMTPGWGWVETPGTSFRVVRFIQGGQGPLYVRPIQSSQDGNGVDPGGHGSWPVEQGREYVVDFERLEFYSEWGDSESRILFEIEIWSDRAAAHVQSGSGAPQSVLLAYSTGPTAFNPAVIPEIDLSSPFGLAWRNSGLSMLAKDGQRLLRFGEDSRFILDGYIHITGTVPISLNSYVALYAIPYWEPTSLTYSWKLLHAWQHRNLNTGASVGFLNAGSVTYSDSSSAPSIKTIRFAENQTGGGAGSVQGEFRLPLTPFKLVLAFNAAETSTNVSFEGAIWARSA